MIELEETVEVFKIKPEVWRETRFILITFQLNQIGDRDAKLQSTLYDLKSKIDTFKSSRELSNLETAINPVIMITFESHANVS